MSKLIFFSKIDLKLTLWNLVHQEKYIVCTVIIDIPWCKDRNACMI